MRTDASPRELVVEAEDRMRRDIKRLQRQTSRATAAAVGMGVFAVAMAGWATLGSGRANSADQGLVAANRFVLQDGAGRTRGEWLVEEDGTSRIVLSDRSGGQRMMLTVQAEGSPGLSLSDQDGNRRVVIGLLPEGTSTMVFADAEGTARAVLGMSPENRADLIFADRQGRTRVGLGVDQEGNSSMIVPEEAVPGPGEGAGN